MPLCACGHALEAGDAFCMGCGKPVATESAVRHEACRKCGRQVIEPASFCSGCGASLAVAGHGAAVPPSSGFQWKWALLTIPIVIGVTLALAITAGVLMVASGVDVEDESRQAMLGVWIVLGGMLLGGMLAGWLSPGRTVLEPGVGLAAALTGANLAMGMTSGILLGWVIPFILGAAGAWIGEWLPKRPPGRR